MITSTTIVTDYDFAQSLNPEALQALEAQINRPMLGLDKVMLAKALLTFAADAEDRLLVNGPDADLEGLMNRAYSVGDDLVASLDDAQYSVLFDGETRSAKLVTA